MDGGALPVHEGVELVEEELLFGVREPAALAAGLHAAHHVLLRAGRGKGQTRTAEEPPEPIIKSRSHTHEPNTSNIRRVKPNLHPLDPGL